MWEDPRLGDEFREEDGSTRIYTMRGWVRCDNEAELREERDRLASGGLE
jgi:hypothetical protein